MILGLTGKNAAGKGEVAEYLKNVHNFRYTSLSDMIRLELKLKGIEPTRDNLFMMGNKLREEHGPDYLARRTLQFIADTQREEGRVVNFVVDSIRSPFEAETLLKAKNFSLIGIDAPAEIRFERLQSRGRAGEGVTNLAEFLAAEARENVAVSTNQQLDKTFQLAQHVLDNGGSKEQLAERIEALLTKLEAQGFGGSA